LVLFFLSRALSQRLSMLFFRLTKSMKATVYLLAFVFLPGTFVHEIAHILMALLLFVKVGKLELLPEVKEDGKVKLGSVQIEQVDIFRRLIIGGAPLLFGLIIIFASLIFLTNKILIGYIIFEIGNTMFSSRKDMEGGIWVVGTILAVSIILYLLGVRISFDSLSPQLVNIFQRADAFLAFPLGIDAFFVILLSILSSST